MSAQFYQKPQPGKGQMMKSKRFKISHAAGKKNYAIPRKHWSASQRKGAGFYSLSFPGKD